MVSVSEVNVNKIPKNSYVAIDKEDTDDRIIKSRLTSGPRVVGDKLVRSVTDYVPKGLKGSKNSNFYEFLSMGLIPNLIGSAMLIYVSMGGNKGATKVPNNIKFASGVVMYAVGKWLGNKIINTGVKKATGVDIDGTLVKRVIKEQPEHCGDIPKTAVEFHKAYESVDFPRFDLIDKQGEQNNNRLEYWDKIAKKMGYTERLNSPEQEVQDKIRKIKTKSTITKSISSYIWAALGVSIAAQEPFGTFMQSARKIHPMALIKEHIKEIGNIFKNRPDGSSMKEVMNSIRAYLDTVDMSTLSSGVFKKVTEVPKEILRVVTESTKSLAGKKSGKILMIAAAASSVLGIILSTTGFKADKNPKKSEVDYKQKYQEF